MTCVKKEGLKNASNPPTTHLRLHSFSPVVVLVHTSEPLLSFHEQNLTNAGSVLWPLKAKGRT